MLLLHVIITPGTVRWPLLSLVIVIVILLSANGREVSWYDGARLIILQVMRHWNVEDSHNVLHHLLSVQCEISTPQSLKHLKYVGLFQKE